MRAPWPPRRGDRRQQRCEHDRDDDRPNVSVGAGHITPVSAMTTTTAANDRLMPEATVCRRNAWTPWSTSPSEMSSRHGLTGMPRRSKRCRSTSRSIHQIRRRVAPSWSARPRGSARAGAPAPRGRRPGRPAGGAPRCPLVQERTEREHERARRKRPDREDVDVPPRVADRASGCRAARPRCGTADDGRRPAQASATLRRRSRGLRDRERRGARQRSTRPARTAISRLEASLATRSV